MGSNFGEWAFHNSIAAVRRLLVVGSLPGVFSDKSPASSALQQQPEGGFAHLLGAMTYRNVAVDLCFHCVVLIFAECLFPKALSGRAHCVDLIEMIVQAFVPEDCYRALDNTV